MKKHIQNFCLSVLLIVLILLQLTGCQNPNYKTYSSESLYFDYPQSFTVEESTETPSVIIVKSENSRLEIFKTADFVNYPGGERIHGYSSSGEEEFEWQFVPKEKIKSGDYEMWLFYEENNETAKQGILRIIKSFR